MRVLETHRFQIKLLQNLLSQIRHKGFGSSSGLKNLNSCGIWTSLANPALLLPWMSHTRDFETFPSFAPLNHHLHSGNSQGCGGFENEAIGVPVTPPSTVSARLCVFRGDEWADLVTGSVAGWVQWSLVSLVFCRNGEILGVQSGTVLHSDGIIVTSAHCLRSLKNTEVKVTVDVRFSDNQARYKGFVLGADVSSGIAFVKIEPREPLKAAKLGKMDSVRTEDRVVAAGCERRFEGQSLLQTFAQSHYDLGVLSPIANETENIVSLSARTSWQFTGSDLETSGIGGPVFNLKGGVLGVMTSNFGTGIKVTPVDLVSEYMELFEKHGNMPNMSNSGVSLL